MSFSDTSYLYALINLVLSSGIGLICMCRFGVMSIGTRVIFRLNYSLLFMAALASGWQPLMFHEWPGVADLLVNACVLMFLIGGRKGWRDGPPQYATRPGFLDTDQYPHVAGGKQ